MHTNYLARVIYAVSLQVVISSSLFTLPVNADVEDKAQSTKAVSSASLIVPSPESHEVPIDGAERSSLIHEKLDELSRQFLIYSTSSIKRKEVDFLDLPDANAVEKITVKNFIFENADKESVSKNLVFTNSELEDVIKKALGIKKLPEELTFTQLIQARSAITQHYIEKGYITSGAYIPTNQSFNTTEEVDVKIAIFEGKLERVTAKFSEKDSKNLNSSDLKLSCLGEQLGTEKTFNQNEVLDNLRLLQGLNPRIESLNATLTQGTKPGRNILNVEVLSKDQLLLSWENFIENPFRHLNFSFSVDNNQSPSIGSVSENLQVSVDQFLDLDFTRTEGSNSFDISLLLPGVEDENCGRLSGNIKAGFKASRIISRPFNELDIESGSRYIDVTFVRQANVYNFHKSLNWGGTFSYRGSDTSILKIPFPISFDANRDGDTNIFALRPYIELTQRTRLGALALRGELSLGSSISILKGDGFFKPFILFRGQTQWANLLAPDIVLVVNGTLQLAGTTLPGLEQLSLGGQDTVRGYRKNLLLADNGFFSSAELQLTIIRSQDWRIKLIPFMDFGTGWNNSGSLDSSVTNTLWSTGIGLLVQNSDRFSMRLDWGVPLIETNFRGDTLQERGFHFSTSVMLQF